MGASKPVRQTDFPLLGCTAFCFHRVWMAGEIVIDFEMGGTDGRIQLREGLVDISHKQAACPVKSGLISNICGSVIAEGCFSDNPVFMPEVLKTKRDAARSSKAMMWRQPIQNIRMKKFCAVGAPLHWHPLLHLPAPEGGNNHTLDGGKACRKQKGMRCRNNPAERADTIPNGAFSRADARGLGII